MITALIIIFIGLYWLTRKAAKEIPPETNEALIKYWKEKNGE